MGLTVLVGDKGYVDLGSPIKMSEEERNSFIKLLKSIFSSSIIKESKVDELRNWRIGDKKLYFRPWIEEEYEILFGIENIDEAMEKLGRSWQAIVVKDGNWRYKFISWCKERGKDFLKGNKLEIIKEFVRENEELKRRNKEKIKKKREEFKNLMKECKELKEKLEKLKRTRELYTDEAFIENQNRMKKYYINLDNKSNTIESISDSYVEKYSKEINKLLKGIENLISK